MQIFTMHQLRRSSSVHHNPSEQKPNQSINRSQDSNSAAHRTPSLDTLVIPGRIRYPSDPPHKHTETTSLDVSVAKNLLDANASKSLDDGPISRLKATEFLHNRCFSSSGFTSLSETPQRHSHSQHFSSRQASGHSSEASKASTGLFSSNETANSDAEAYASQYNELASKYSLASFQIDEDGEQDFVLHFLGTKSYP